MNLDREWMYLRKIGGHMVAGFEEKVKEFVNFARSHPECMDEKKIKCPCSRCQNKPYLDPDSVEYHIVSNGFKPDYYRWILHGEYIFQGGDETAGPSTYNNENTYGYDSFCASEYESMHNTFGFDNDVSQDDNPNAHDRYREMVMDAAGPTFQYPTDNLEPPNPNAQRFYDTMREQETPLYDGCRHSILSAVTRLMNIKAENGFSEKCYDMIVSLMDETMPEGNQMPQSFYETKKLVEPLGLPVERIDCCSSGCMLYWGEDINRTTCKVCDQPKGGKNSVLWYFPLTHRLQRLYASEATAKYMRWHAEHESEPGIMSHPSDSEAWKHFNNTHPMFSNENRNVRLALSTDGFMPFGQFGKPYSSWPVILNPYNLPPGMFMKDQFMFLTVLIPGPRYPNQKLDVYLQPLIEELKFLWNNGSLTYDCSRKQNFMMHVALMWTISDFPAYAMLSGWSTKGHLACPICMEDSDSWYLPKGHKQTWFDNHRKFLPPNHPFRKDTKGFIKDRCVTKIARPPKSGVEILNEIDNMGLIKITEPNHHTNNKRVRRRYDCGWRKRSIFWDLPGWKTNMIRHNLDVMHIEKNCFENVFNTIMDIKGKTKDNENSRQDMKTFCKRPAQDKDANGVYPPPDYRLDKKKARLFLSG